MVVVVGNLTVGGTGKTPVVERFAKELIKKKDNLKKMNYQNTWINVNQKILEIIYEN